MKKNIAFILFIICFPFTIYSQKWQQYSDSIMSNIRKNDLEKASRFIELADKELVQSKVMKDTLYADYLYRKGVVQSFQGNYDTNIFIESLSIWEASPN
jgi:hypothetical protein